MPTAVPPVTGHGQTLKPRLQFLAAMWPGASSIHSLFFLRELTSSEYYQEINEMAEIKSVAPNFQTNTIA